MFQILSNFSLLIAVDTIVFGDKCIQWFSIISALNWALYLTWTREAPSVVRLGSLLSVTLGYYVAQDINLRNLEVLIYTGFGCIWVVYLFSKDSFAISKGARDIFLLLVLKNLLGFFILEKYRGLFGKNIDSALIIYFTILFLISLRSDRSFGNQFVSVIYGTVCGQIIATLTDNSVLYMHSCAFTATLLQGLAHGISRVYNVLHEMLRSIVEYPSDNHILA